MNIVRTMQWYCYYLLYYAKTFMCKVDKKTYRNRVFDKLPSYFGGKRILVGEKVNQYLYDNLSKDNPFMVGRIGEAELFLLRTLEFERVNNYEKVFKQVRICAGIFDIEESNAKMFLNEMQRDCNQVDVIGYWYQPLEEYFMRHYMDKGCITVPTGSLEPWLYKNPWTRVLENKTVLVVHPFTKSIEAQYQKREKIFPGTNILPKFNLKTFQAVQTIGGERDDRFSTWMEALEYMASEIEKIEFDIAIIGCGAYGFPLAARVKRQGKKVIHLGGVTQILFGIKGGRWEEDMHIKPYISDAWVYPTEDETPKHASLIEESAYWKRADKTEAIK